MPVQPGEILRFEDFYVELGTGESKCKYLLVLAVHAASGDVVWRLLTSRQHARPEIPACYHGDPYPGFYLGVIDPGGGLGSKSWLDLRFLSDGDDVDLARKLAAGRVQLVSTLAPELFRDASACVANADDTTIAQERAIRDQLAG